MSKKSVIKNKSILQTRSFVNKMYDFFTRQTIYFIVANSRCNLKIITQLLRNTPVIEHLCRLARSNT